MVFYWKKTLFCCNMIKIPLNKVICLAHGFFLSNWTTKLDWMVKLILALKLDSQSNLFFNLIIKVVLNQKFSNHLSCLLKPLKRTARRNWKLSFFLEDDRASERGRVCIEGQTRRWPTFHSLESRHRSTGDVVVLKQIYLSKLNPHLQNGLNCELSFLSSINHSNIIRLLHVFQV